MKDTYLTQYAFAQMLGVTDSTVKYWLDKGIIKAEIQNGRKMISTVEYANVIKNEIAKQTKDACLYINIGKDKDIAVKQTEQFIKDYQAEHSRKIIGIDSKLQTVLPMAMNDVGELYAYVLKMIEQLSVNKEKNIDFAMKEQLLKEFQNDFATKVGNYTREIVELDRAFEALPIRFFKAFERYEIDEISDTDIEYFNSIKADLLDVLSDELNASADAGEKAKINRKIQKIENSTIASFKTYVENLAKQSAGAFGIVCSDKDIPRLLRVSKKDEDFKKVLGFKLNDNSQVVTKLRNQAQQKSKRKDMIAYMSTLLGAGYVIAMFCNTDNEKEFYSNLSKQLSYGHFKEVYCNVPFEELPEILKAYLNGIKFNYAESVDVVENKEIEITQETSDEVAESDNETTDIIEEFES